MTGPLGSSMRREIVTWSEVDKLIDILVPQIKSVGGFDGMIIITRGGIIPGGLLAEALDMPYVMTAAVKFPDPIASDLPTSIPAQFSMPSFLQFPENKLLVDRKFLLVDDVWGSGRTSSAVKGRCEAAKSEAYTCVLHYNPYRSLFTKEEPSFYGAVTDAYIVYPWELDRGIDGLLRPEPQV